MTELSMLDREAEQIVKEIGIPPCPATLTALLRKMREDEPDFAKIGQLISGDVSLSAAMLKTVNSTFYGLRTKATSVQQALAMLGLRTVGNLVTGLLLRQAFPVSAHRGIEDFWEMSGSVALISSHLASQVRGISRDEVYTYGLFRNCGIPLMICKFPNYTRIYSSAIPALGRPLTAVEDEQYSMNHARVGYHLAKSWQLDDAMCQAILWHHDHQVLQSTDAAPPAMSRKFIALAFIAEQMYTRVSNGADCLEWAAAGEAALSSVGLTAAAYNELSAEVIELLAKQTQEQKR